MKETCSQLCQFFGTPYWGRIVGLAAAYAIITLYGVCWGAYHLWGRVRRWWAS